MSVYDKTVIEHILNYEQSAYVQAIKAINYEKNNSKDEEPNTQINFEVEARQNIKSLCDYLFNNVKSEDTDVIKLRQEVGEKILNSSPEILEDLLTKIQFELKKAEYIEVLSNKLFPNDEMPIQIQNENKAPIQIEDDLMMMASLEKK